MAPHKYSHAEESNPPIEISRSRKLAAPLSLVIAFTGAVVALSVAWSDQHSTTIENAKQIIDLHSGVKSLEEKYDEISKVQRDTQRDVEWIRRTMEGRYSPVNGPSGK